MMRETACHKCGCLAGSSHTTREACITRLRSLVQEARATYMSWQWLLAKAEAAWDKEISPQAR